MIFKNTISITCCLMAVIFNTEAFMGFYKGKSLTFHEPPIQTVFDIESIVKENYITQRLDNFDAQNNRTFQMRYFTNGNFFKHGGPIFIYVGGQWEISSYILLGGHFYDMAKEFNGYLVHTEHRYYGKTRPTKDRSTENLKYLSIDQSIADLAHFVTKIKQEPQFKESRVILAGASYAGVVVTWFRQKYPHLSAGAWSSGAPLLPTVEYQGYKEVVAASILKIGGQECLDKIAKGFQVTEELIRNGEYERVRRLYSLCYDFDGTDNYNFWSFLSTIFDIFGITVLIHTNGTIERACDVILRKNSNHTGEEDELLGFAEYVKSQIPASGCSRMNYEDHIKDLMNIEWNDSVWRQWTYQICSELGWHRTSSFNNPLFGSGAPIELFIRICNDAYGSSFTNATLHDLIERKNTMYGGLNVEVTNVIFTHGSLDPWHKIGVPKNLKQHSSAVIITDAAHCQDFGPIDFKTDSKEMIYSKIAVRNSIKKWLEL